MSEEFDAKVEQNDIYLEQQEEEARPVTSADFVSQATEGTLELQVYRADTDTWEEPYIAAYYHKNPWKQAKWESDNLDYVTEETGARLRQSILKRVPKVGLGLAAVGTLTYLVTKIK